jgi:hypothetical protein
MLTQTLARFPLVAVRVSYTLCICHCATGMLCDSVLVKTACLASLEKAVVVCFVSAAVQPCILLSALCSQQLPSVQKPHEALQEHCQQHSVEH